MTALNLKLNVAHAYWRVLVEQSELFGMAFGGGVDSASVPSVWPEPNDESRALDAKLAEALWGFWQAYPAVDNPAAQAALIALWQEAIGLERPYRFESAASEDVLYVTDKRIG